MLSCRDYASVPDLAAIKSFDRFLATLVATKPISHPKPSVFIPNLLDPSVSLNRISCLSLLCPVQAFLNFSSLVADLICLCPRSAEYSI